MDRQRMQPQPILHFWFTELTPKQHYAKDAALNETIRTRFGATLEAAAKVIPPITISCKSRKFYERISA